MTVAQARDGMMLRRCYELAAVELCEQVLQVEVLRDHRQAAIAIMGPLFARAIPIDLDAVSIGVMEVNRFTDPVIRGAVDAHTVI